VSRRVEPEHVQSRARSSLSLMMERRQAALAAPRAPSASARERCISSAFWPVP
jgi:hypothetical protein